MSDAVPSQTTPSEPLATPIILVIAIGGYMILLGILLVIRQFLVTRGICVECAPCGKEDGSLQCCPCWIAVAESCNCCSYPNIKTCLNSLCGNTRNICTVEKCVTCQVCANICGPESGCECAGCDCACQPPECETIDCLCFKMQVHWVGWYSERKCNLSTLEWYVIWNYFVQYPNIGHLWELLQYLYAVPCTELYCNGQFFPLPSILTFDESDWPFYILDKVLNIVISINLANFGNHLVFSPSWLSKWKLYIKYL